MTPTPESVEELAKRLEFKAQSSFEMNHRAGRKGKEWALETEIEWQAAQTLRTLSAQVADANIAKMNEGYRADEAEAENAALREQVGALRDAGAGAVTALENHACHGGPGLPCIRTKRECDNDCGKLAGNALLALRATLQATQQKEGE